MTRLNKMSRHLGISVIVILDGMSSIVLNVIEVVPRNKNRRCTISDQHISKLFILDHYRWKDAVF